MVTLDAHKVKLTWKAPDKPNLRHLSDDGVWLVLLLNSFVCKLIADSCRVCQIRHHMLDDSR